MPLDLILANCVLRNADGILHQAGQLGLLYIAGVAQQNGFQVKVVAGDDVAPDIEFGVRCSSIPPLVGFYVNSDNLFEVLRLARRLKRTAPSVRTILGGPVANAQDVQLVSDPGVDYVGRGDGEYLVLDVLRHLSVGAPPLSEIAGLTYKDESGIVVQNASRALIRDLDALPIPDRSLYPVQQVGVRSHVVTSRGCGFRCTFCYESTNRKYRAHSPKRVIEEMLDLQERYGTTYFAFVDDVFTQNPRRVSEICELLLRHFRPHQNLFWYCEARVDSLARYPELLPMMKEAGLVRIQIGTESGSQEVIDAYKKAITLEQICSTVRQCEAAQLLSVFTNFIIGGALETEQTFAQTLALAKSLLRAAPGRFECNTTFLSPYPMTDIERNPHIYDIEILDPDFVTGLSDDYIFARTKELSKSQIIELARVFHDEIRNEMVDILAGLPPNLIREHLRMNDHTLQTAWSDLFRGDDILAGWARCVRSRNFTSTIDPEDAEADEVLPQRTFPLRRCRDGMLNWIARGRCIEFGDYELFLVELCAGKLTLREIVDRAARYCDSDLNLHREQLRRDICSYLQSLADELLLVFRQDRWGALPDVRQEAQTIPSATVANPVALHFKEPALVALRESIDAWGGSSAKGVRLRVVN